MRSCTRETQAPSPRSIATSWSAATGSGAAAAAAAVAAAGPRIVPFSRFTSLTSLRLGTGAAHTDMDQAADVESRGGGRGSFNLGRRGGAGGATRARPAATRRQRSLVIELGAAATGLGTQRLLQILPQQLVRLPSCNPSRCCKAGERPAGHQDDCCVAGEQTCSALRALRLT